MNIKNWKEWKMWQKVLSIAGILVIAAVITFVLLIPHMRFSEAMDLLEAKDYAGSIAILEELAQKEKPEWVAALSDARHREAENLFEAEKYEEALAYAQAHSCFTAEEIAAYDRAERYDRACTLMQEDAGLTEAQEMFLALGEYKDSVQLASDCVYRLRVLEAQSYADALDYERALSTLLADERTENHENITAYETARMEDLSAAQAELSGKIAAGNFFTVLLGEDGLHIYGSPLHLDAKEIDAEKLYSGVFTVAGLKDGHVTLSGYRLLGEEEAAKWTDITDLSVGLNHLLALHVNGTVTAIGQDQYQKLAVSDWTNVKDVAAGLYHSAALLSDGTVTAIGEDSLGQCATGEWKDIVQIAAGLNHTLGLKSDGTVVAVGDNASGQCEVSSWKQVKAIYAAGFTSYALCEDGTVLACGDNTAGQCEVQELRWVAELAPGIWNVSALHRDGSVSFIGNSRYAQEDAQQDTALVRYEAEQHFGDLDAQEKLCEKVIWPVDESAGPWLYVSDTEIVEITRHYEADCRSRFYTAHIYTAGGTDLITDGFWTDNARGRVFPEKIAQKYQAIYAQNGNFFYDSENTKRGPDIRNGVTYKTVMGPDFFYFDKNGAMVTCMTKAEEWTFEKLEAMGLEHVYGFGPALVKDGELVEEKHMRATTIFGTNPRSAFGSFENGHYVGMVVDGRKPGISTGINLYRLAQQFYKIGCSEAYNLDGGQSSCMCFMGVAVTNHRNENMFNGQRRVPDILVIGTSELAKGLPE